MKELQLNNGQTFQVYANTNRTWDIWVHNPNDVPNSLRDLDINEISRLHGILGDILSKDAEDSVT